MAVKWIQTHILVENCTAYTLAGTDGWSEERLAALVTRDSMIGVALARVRPDVA